MERYGRLTRTTCAMAIASLVAACGGGGGSPAPSPAPTSAADTAAPSASTPVATATPASVVPQGTGSTVDKAFSDRVLEAMNAARAVSRKCGTVDYPAAGPVRWNVQTEQAARTQAEYLQQNNLFGHAGANGSTVGDRLTATGYVWYTVGENLAAGYTDMAEVVKGWIDSPSHCVNVMNPTFVDLGVVMVPGTSANTYRTYWGMVMARPR
jgi:uncharacterized protein YkwD